MSTLRDSKKGLKIKLDQLKVLRILLSFVLMFPWVFSVSPMADAIPYSGAIVIQGGNQSTYFFSHRPNTSPSYVLRASSGATLVNIRNGQDSYLFKIMNSVIDEAVVEKRFKNFRAIATFRIQANKYRLRKLVLTDRFAFADDGTCPKTQLQANSAPALQFNDAVGVSKVEPKPEKANTCSNLDEDDQKKIDRLKNYFIGSDLENINLKNCLNDTDSLVKKIQAIDPKMQADTLASLKTAIPLVRQSLAARTPKDDKDSKENKEAKPAIAVGCKVNSDSKSSSRAKYDLPTNEIDFFIQKPASGTGENTLLAHANIEETFIHEFVHMSLAQPSVCISTNEDEIAADIANICSQPIPCSDCAGSNLDGTIKPLHFDNPAAPDPSLPDAVRVAESTAIQLTHAADQIPPQRVDQASVDFVSTLPETESAPAAVDGALQVAFQAPMSTFANAADKVAAVVIPRAQAETSRAQAAQSTRGATASASSRQSVDTPLVVREDVVVPDPQNPSGFVMQEVTPAAAHAPADTGNFFLAAAPAAAAPAAATTAANGVARNPASDAPKAQATGDIKLATTTIPQNLLGSSYDRQLAQQQPQQAQQGTQPQRGPRLSFKVAGITFENQTMKGPEYRKYAVKMNSEGKTFTTQLEQGGILIFRNGKVLTQPRPTAFLYIDTGKELLFGSTKM